MEKKDGHHWIARLKAEGLTALESLYLAWRTDFLEFAKRYDASKEDILDVYQDALIIFYENIKSGKLNELTSSPKTYLFSVGKYTLLNKLKGRHNLVNLEIEKVEQPTGLEPIEPLNNRQELMLNALKQLGPTCKRLIELFYYEKLSIKEIVTELNLKNENTVKAHKSRCIKSMREKINKWQSKIKN